MNGPRIHRLEDLHTQCLRRLETILPLLAQDAQGDKRAIFIMVELVEAMPGIQVGQVHCHEQGREVTLIRQDYQLLQVMPNLILIVLSVDSLNSNFKVVTMVRQEVCRARLQNIGDLLHLHSEVDVKMANLAVEMCDLDLLMVVLNYLVSREIVLQYCLTLLMDPS